MAEFKRLSDVEVVAEPTESANVLIEEDGVIKKAPKTAVGGAGGGGISYDAIIAVAGNPYMSCDFSECDISADTTEILNVVEKLQNNEIVNVAIKYYYTYGTNEYYSFIPASVRCRAEGTTNSGDNQLNIGCLMTSYHNTWYTININFSTTDGSYIDSTYKTITLT